MSLPTIAITKGLFKNDPNGAALDADMAALGAQLNALSPTVNSALYKLIQDKLYAKAIETVSYYMTTGRLNPYSVLANISQ